MTSTPSFTNPPITLTLSDGKEYKLAMIENRHLLRLEEKLRLRRIKELMAFMPQAPIEPADDDPHEEKAFIRKLEAFISVRDEEISGQQLSQYSGSIGGQIQLGIMAITECNPKLDPFTVERLITNELPKIMNAIHPPPPPKKSPPPAPDETTNGKGPDPTPPKETVKKTDQSEALPGAGANP